MTIQQTFLAACKEGDLAKVQSLDLGAVNLNQGLKFASGSGHLEVVKVLIAAGVSAEDKNEALRSASIRWTFRGCEGVNSSWSKCRS